MSTMAIHCRECRQFSRLVIINTGVTVYSFLFIVMCYCCLLFGAESSSLLTAICSVFFVHMATMSGEL